MKDNVKAATSFIGKFEVYLINYAKNGGYDGVICGHIHQPDIKLINDIIYMNSGDWVENMSALVENHDGTFEIVYFIK
jgi:UDP-2,3-diacylglucosamine pyrophosphatase LpxH